MHTSLLTPSRLAAAALFALALSSSVAAQCPEEPALQLWTGAGTTVCPCFVPGEEAGSVLNIPAAHLPAEILRVGIGWGSQFGGGPQSLEQSIHIYNAGLPNPGTPIFSLPGPVLTDGAINEFDLEPLPGMITVASNPVTVTLEFLNSNAGDIFAPSVVHDGNGCTGGGNVVKAIPGGWSNACSLGVSGDWLFYVIYRPLNCGGPNQTYCVTSQNSAGPGAQIGFLGSTSVAANDLILTCTDLPTGQLGIFFYGSNQVQLPFGDGFVCVQGNTSRILPALTSDVFGNVSRVVDYSTNPFNAGVGKIDPGDTWNFQFWYRDPNFGGAGFNLSDGLSLQFTN